jgi:hypothetical protein
MVTGAGSAVIVVVTGASTGGAEAVSVEFSTKAISLLVNNYLMNSMQIPAAVGAAAAG